ncbi:hypothetical protein [Candidatus Protochlamydia amoebophila]|uniref:Uncharacterized protein n=1 Tax=Protochlamydia amoebophila (strain UWE25) TaxID=264201 RepID=Q6MB67_PARUW|nr:hypothetical protein [Candidatus Protochlamydia amoebophila]CAF24182.1 unnamed protein product [Candidatus Protochlamydia amoebophila UWE25]
MKSKTQPTEKETSPKEKSQFKEKCMISAQVCPGVYAKSYALRFKSGDPRLNNLSNKLLKLS